MKLFKSRGLKTVGALAAIALVLTGCSSNGGSSTTTPEPTESAGGDNGQERAIVSTLSDGLIRPDEGGDPVPGGTFRWAAYTEPTSLDPARTIYAASTGGIEMLNTFDSIMRWDGDNQQWVTQTAESLTPNDTFDEWELKLNSGITFSDGQAYDAEAVKASQERYADIPTSPEGGTWLGNVKSIEVIDDLTLKYTLANSWMGFPSILSTGPGLIVAPGTAEGDDFEPVGAGPFKLAEWVPGEKMVFEAYEDYWAGTPYLDGYESVFLNDQQVGIDSLKSGSVDATFTLQPNFAAQVVEAGYNGNTSNVGAAMSAIINASEGMPGHDVRVRKAIQLAVDPQIVADRAFEGTVTTAIALFPSWSPWGQKEGEVTPNQEEARTLLEAAMADGYDGKLEYLEGNDATSRNRAVAIQAQLEAVGFDVELTYTRTIADRIQRIAVDKDYQMSAWGVSIRDADPLPRLFSNLHSTGTQTYLTYTSDEMDGHIEDFQQALTPEAQKEAMDKIQKQMNEDVPFLSWGQFAEVFAWDNDVHGIIGSATSTVHLGKAWIEQ